MKLYEVNQQLQELLTRLEPDPETGEIPANEDQILEEIHALSLRRDDILRYLAEITLNAQADIRALKEEETRLKDRRTRLERRKENLLSILDRECGGQKTDLGIATLSYRHNSRVEFPDPQKAYAWLRRHKYSDCYRIPDPELSKTAVGKLLDAGEKIPGAEKVPTVSVSLR